MSFQNDLFEKINSGESIYDDEQFKKWLEDYCFLKDLFGKYLNDNGYFDGIDNLIELTESKSICSIKNLRVNKKIIESQAGEGCFAKPFNGILKGHLIVDGIYDNQLIYLARIVANGGFTIGYCGKKDSLYTKRVIDYYNKIKKFLNLIVEIENVKVKEKTINKNKIIVLDFRK